MPVSCAPKTASKTPLTERAARSIEAPWNSSRVALGEPSTMAGSAGLKSNPTPIPAEGGVVPGSNGYLTSISPGRSRIPTVDAMLVPATTRSVIVSASRSVSGNCSGICGSRTRPGSFPAEAGSSRSANAASTWSPATSM